MKNHLSYLVIFFVISINLSSPAQSAESARREIFVMGYKYVKITDDKGNSNTRVNDSAILKIPGVNAHYNADQSRENHGMMILDFSNLKKITLEGDPRDFAAIEINDSDENDKLIASTTYNFVANHKWELKVEAKVLTLRVDKNDDNKFSDDEIIAPSPLGSKPH